MSSLRLYEISNQEREQIKQICRVFDIRDYSSLEKQCAIELGRAGSIQRDIVLRFLSTIGKAWSASGALTQRDQNVLIECARAGHWLSRATIMRRYFLSAQHWASKISAGEMHSWLQESKAKRIQWLEYFISRAPWSGKYEFNQALTLSSASVMLSVIPVASLKCYLGIIEDGIQGVCQGEEDTPDWKGCCELAPGIYASCTVIVENSIRTLEVRWSHAYGDLAIARWTPKEAGWLEHVVHLRAAANCRPQDITPEVRNIFSFA